MYGKLFAQMYDGTLATRGPWQALVTFQQLIVLADKHGDVDMTAEAISRRTTIPLEIITIGLAELVLPDEHSRSPDEDGRRIVLVDPGRAWGWRVVNYDHYRKIRSEEDRREYHKQYARKRREALKSGDGNGHSVNQNVNNSQHINPPSSESTKAVSSKQEAKEQDQKKKRQSPSATAMPELPIWLEQESWLGFVAMRERERHPLTPRAAKLIFNELSKLRDAGNDPVAVLDQSTRNGWRDVYAIKTGETHANRRTGRKLSVVEQIERDIDDRKQREAAERKAIPGLA